MPTLIQIKFDGDEIVLVVDGAPVRPRMQNSVAAAGRYGCHIRLRLTCATATLHELGERRRTLRLPHVTAVGEHWLHGLLRIVEHIAWRVSQPPAHVQ